MSEESPSSFHAPRATADPKRFELAVERHLCVGPPERQFMMGGVGLASAVSAMERVTGRPLVWATAQFLAPALPGDELEIEVSVPAAGIQVSQARATARKGEREVIAVAAALGARQDERERQFAEMPSVPGPEACDEELREETDLPDLFTRLERRRVDDPEGEGAGRARMWMRTREEEPVTAGLLAVFADFLPGAIPETRGSSSLDNTLRIHGLRPARWCLLDTRIHGFGAGLFHGETRIFAADGALLATASQSGAVARSRPAAPGR